MRILHARAYPLSAVCLILSLGCDSASSSSTSSSTTSGPGPSDTPALDLVIDDFEDADAMTSVGGSWYSYTDVDNGGGSTLEFPQDDAGAVIMTGEGFNSERSLEVAFDFEQGELTYDPYIGIGASLGSATAPLDLSAYATLRALLTSSWPRTSPARQRVSVRTPPP